ncbi:MAG TPA: PilT/PilU family type 4a pilus ATPase [Pseudomonadales bacterium]|nr:PilT/PilU family type 4a pilus ATPase [Pseudomonadales bacterium]
MAACITGNASDLHLATDRPPMLRVDGKLIVIQGESSLPKADVDAFAAELLDASQSKILDARGDCDGAITVDGARFRFNIFRRGGNLCVALRRLEERFRNLRDLGLPESLYELCDLPDGLVIVAGPTGAGKSTTLAALIDRINQTHSCHIITIEDPIEYVHAPALALINQRQVGMDCPGFNDALVASLREDPDVILVGEVRELETIRTAITAAETGHLVLTTVHAGDCVGVVERLVSVFPAGEQEGIRRQISLVLRAVVTQQLLICDGTLANSTMAHANRRSRVVASEILMVNSAVANLIAIGKSSQIYSSIEIGAGQGMQTLEQDLARLHVSGHISETTALAFAKNQRTLRDRVNRLRAQPSARANSSAIA